MKQYETVIGLEVHVELATKTKIFCGCSTEFGGAPNTHTCPVCTGMPGSLPVLNRQVVEFALKAGIAANCQINQYCKFDRKNYFYPDNPQNYQISQLYLPICHDGWVEIETSAGKKKVRIHEMHMEEDAGKLIHDEWEDCSLVDYNRSGVPLLEEAYKKYQKYCRTSANMCPAIEFSIHDPESIYSDMEYPLPLSSKDRGDLELVPYYNEHPLVNEAIRQVEQLQKQQEKKKHRDVAR